ncbi:neuronal acetylcholine receptor subunit alpha-9-like isoform X2 [Amphiura filiformis]|uniref:neuronal acetylcholine receptor subunit alpha-9-like isoform X2 n=1 Tax=Amphiura filiformis TaxID=82378 RepID=UPI003B2187EA
MEYTALFHRVLLHLLSIMLVTYLNTYGVHSSNSHLELLDKLFFSSRYNKLVRPVQDESLPVNVTLQLILTDITMVDEMNHQVELNVWMRQVWKDEYLTWNKMQYDGKDKIVVPSEMIWLPDIILYNSVEDPGRKIEKSTHVMVYSDGTIRWSQSATLRFACLMRLTAFLSINKIVAFALVLGALTVPL